MEACLMTKLEMLNRLDTEAVRDCRKCGLCETRRNTVFGTGNPNTRVMFVGEAPGQNEDEQGLPFVGKAGELLTAMINACGWRREDVFIANTIKCRPPGNRVPTPTEKEACRPYLELQIKLVNPEYIVCLGGTAMSWFFPATPEWKKSISHWRGKIHPWQDRKIVVTYHPSYILHSDTDAEADQKKGMVWADFQILLEDMRLNNTKTPMGK